MNGEPATVKEVMTFFEMTAADFMKEWKVLSDKDKDDLKNGVGNGTLNY